VSDRGTVTLELVAIAETGDRGEIGEDKLGAICFRPANQSKNRNASEWVPRRWVLDITENYSVNQGEILDVEMPAWKAEQLGWV
jgi:hypothetical protein